MLTHEFCLSSAWCLDVRCAICLEFRVGGTEEALFWFLLRGVHALHTSRHPRLRISHFGCQGVGSWPLCLTVMHDEYSRRVFLQFLFNPRKYVIREAARLLRVCTLQFLLLSFVSRRRPTSVKVHQLCASLCLVGML